MRRELRKRQRSAWLHTAWGVVMVVVVVGIAVWREGDAVAEVSYGNLRTEDQI